MNTNIVIKDETAADISAITEVTLASVQVPGGKQQTGHATSDGSKLLLRQEKEYKKRTMKLTDEIRKLLQP